MKLWEMAWWGMENSGRSHPLDAMLDGYDYVVDDREEGETPAQFNQVVMDPISGAPKTITFLVNHLWRWDEWDLVRIYHWLKALDI